MIKSVFEKLSRAGKYVDLDSVVSKYTLECDFIEDFYRDEKGIILEFSEK